MHILLITESELPESTVKYLRQAHMSVEIVSGLSHLEPLATPDVIVLDCGDDFLKRLARVKQHPNHYDVPALVIIPADADLRIAALKAGAIDFLTAPLEPVELVHRIKRLRMANAPGDLDVLGHDLKSPLGTILPSLDLITQTFDTEYPELLELAGDALQAARRQTMLIDNFLDYWRIRSGLMEHRLVDVYLDEIIETFRQKVQSSLGRRDLNIGYELPEALPVIHADVYLLVNALVAVADNAIKFCARESKIKVVVHLYDDYVEIAIMDTGRSITPEYADRLFELHDQFNVRLAGGRTSVALNLPFARAALRVMNGDVNYSLDNNWNIFAITIPRS